MYQFHFSSHLSNLNCRKSNAYIFANLILAYLQTMFHHEIIPKHIKGYIKKTNHVNEHQQIKNKFKSL